MKKICAAHQKNSRTSAEIISRNSSTTHVVDFGAQAVQKMLPRDERKIEVGA
jgi:hypothetical protein